jgi:glycosyltransferase involved in cell wall biosynthesis
VTPDLSASVVIPTTGDRGPVLRFAVDSALRQTVNDIEVLIIGDGADDTTKAAIAELIDADARVRFFDFPKHERRGEPNRHQVLTEHARGRVIAYMCDRDLLFPDHVAELARLLEHADLAYTLRFSVLPDGTFEFIHALDLRDPRQRAEHRTALSFLPLSFTGHTADAYRRLPYGWRTTPPTAATDRYMWSQFLDQPWCRVAASALPTALRFSRGEYPGPGTEARRRELVSWVARLEDPDRLRRDIQEALWSDWASRYRHDQRVLSLLQREGPVRAARGAARQVRDRVRTRSSNTSSEPNASARGETIDGANGQSMPRPGSDQ